MFIVRKHQVFGKFSTGSLELFCITLVFVFELKSNKMSHEGRYYHYLQISSMHRLLCLSACDYFVFRCFGCKISWDNKMLFLLIFSFFCPFFLNHISIKFNSTAYRYSLWLLYKEQTNIMMISLSKFLTFNI